MAIASEGGLGIDDDGDGDGLLCEDGNAQTGQSGQCPNPIRARASAAGAAVGSGQIETTLEAEYRAQQQLAALENQLKSAGLGSGGTASGGGALRPSSQSDPSQHPVAKSIDAVELVKLMHQLFEGKEPQKPLFLVLYGPPGSGKTLIVTKLLQIMRWQLHNYAEIIVDKMLRRITGYRRLMSALRLNRASLSEEEYIARAQNIYAGYRPVIKYFSAMLLDIALRQRLNILFETTGTDEAQVTDIVTNAHGLGYQIQIVYPYVRLDELIKRVRKRNERIGRAIPLPLVTHMANTTITRFVRLLKYADSAYLYDNNQPFEAPLLELFVKERDRIACNRPALANYTDLMEPLEPICVDGERTAKERAAAREKRIAVETARMRARGIIRDEEDD